MSKGAVATLALALLMAGTIAAPGALAEGDSAASPAPGWWVAGDLHIHTTYSHDSYGGPGDDNTDPLENPPWTLEDLLTVGHPPASQFAVARARGLDYLAITDHNDARSQGHFDEAGPLIPIHGYEDSLDGHAQVLGVPGLLEDADGNGAIEGDERDLDGDGERNKSSDVAILADMVRDRGGIFQINHPMEGSVDHPNDPDWGYGYDVVPDTIEVWNISRLWQPPAPSASSNDDAVRWWESWLDAGYRIGATGGSDNHYVATTPVQGAGQPTTWVYVTEPGEAGVIEGLRAGRTFISHQPPAFGGPRIFLEGDSDGDGTFESMVGDDVVPGSQLRVRVENGAGSLLHVATNGGETAFEAVPVTSANFQHRFTVREDKRWVRAEILEPDGQNERRWLCDDQLGSKTTYCRNRLIVLAMTSALYLQEATQQTQLAFTASSATTGQHSDDVRLEAQLTTLAGEPLGGRTIDFQLVGPESRSFIATTGADGIAPTTITLTERPDAYQLFVHYAGEDGYDASSNTVGFVIEKEDTDLALSKTDRGAQAKLIAVLSDRDSRNGVAAKTITFFADGTPICDAVTDGRGEAVCEPPPRYRNGPQDYLAVFQGDDYYLASEGRAE